MEPPIALLVDDDNDFRTLFSEVLREEGYDVVEAANGVEAIAALDAVTPGVVLIDLVMPIMNGWALFTLLRKRSELRTVPIIFLSAVPKLAPPGATLTVSKPLSLSNLTTLLNALRSPQSSSGEVAVPASRPPPEVLIHPLPTSRRH